MALLAAALACGLEPPPQQPQGQQAPPGDTNQQALPPPNYALVWSDEFDGGALDPGRWRTVSGARQSAVDTPDAVTVQDGALRVTTYTEGGTNHSGFVTTNGLFQAQYGYFEARIRFDDSPGSWCAFWISDDSIGDPLGDPGKAGVEIDVVEHRATDQGGWDALRDMVALNLNWDGYDQHKKNLQKVTALPDGAPVQGTWHVYGVLWSAAGYTFYVDGMQLWTEDAPVSHRPEDLRLTCEVDDGGWAGFVPKGGYGDRRSSTTRMEVDWVRVWQPRS